MRLVPLFAVSALALAACKREEPAVLQEVKVLGQARRALAQRDAKLTSYHATVDSTEAGVTAHHDFFFRAPNRMLGIVTAPVPFSYSFDGERQYRLVPADQKLQVITLKLSPDKGTAFLTKTFSPFIPEGYRTPLLPMEGASARVLKHENGTEAWELSVVLRGADDGPVNLAYFLRVPTGDFLGKRIESSSVVEEVEVVAEHCDAALGLCVPKKLVHKTDGKVVSEVSFSSIELNPGLPMEQFSLTAPAGFETLSQELKDLGR